MKIQSFDQFLTQGYPDVGDYLKLGLSANFAVDIASGSTSDADLIRVMVALNRFSQHIQFEYNCFMAEFMRLKRKFENALLLTIRELNLEGKGTDKTRKAAALDQNKELLKIEEQLDEAEYQAKLREKFPDLLDGGVQIIKRELDRRVRGKVINA